MNDETQRVIMALAPVGSVIKGAIAYRMGRNTPERGQMISEQAIKSYVLNNFKAMGLDGMNLECICWAAVVHHFEPKEESGETSKTVK